MNRRSILSTLCTGALALLAPVVAWAKPCRRVRFRNYGVKGMMLGRDGQWYYGRMKYDAANAAYTEALERVAAAAARIYNEGSVLSDAGRPTARFVRRNSREATLELEASLHDLRDNYPASVMLAYGRELPPVSDVSILRALLAEARDMIHENVMVRRSRIGTGEATYEGYLRDLLAQTDLHDRIDAALKGDKRNA